MSTGIRCATVDWTMKWKAVTHRSVMITCSFQYFQAIHEAQQSAYDPELKPLLWTRDTLINRLAICDG